MKLKLLKITTFSIIVILFIANSSFMFLGTQARYIQDDYCYGEKIRNEGFFKTQFNSYFYSVPYSGNRYSLTLFSGIFDLFSEGAYPFFTFISIILFISGLILLLSNLSRISPINLHIQQILIIAFSIAFLTLYISPNRFQTVFFRSGSLPYFYPIIFNIWIGYLLLKYINYENKHLLYIIACITFLSSGFSEVGTVVQFSFWTFLLSLFIFRKKNKKLILAASVVVAVSIIGLILLILCPNNYERQVNFGDPNTIYNLFKFGPAFGLDFIRYSIKGYYIPIFALILLASLMSLQIETPFVDLKETIIFVFITILISYLLIVANILPSLYAYRAYPNARGLMPATFIIIIAFFLIGLSVGWLIKGIIYRNKTLFNSLQILLFFIMAIYFARSGIRVFSEYPQYHQRASLWDARHAYILEQIDHGEKELLVSAIDSFYMTFELQPEPYHWVNKCAARWYGIDSLKTNM